MSICIKHNGWNKHREVLERSIVERNIQEKIEMMIEFHVDSSIGPKESYSITHNKEVWNITGADEIGLYYGIGKFLHTANWSKGKFVPIPTKEVISPDCSFRAIYFSIHFYNWYQMASTEEFERYIEELLLWGYNTIVCIIPVVNLDGFEDELYHEMVHKVKSVFRLAKNLGMEVGIIINPNQGFKTAPHDYDADLTFEPSVTKGGRILRGVLGRNLCPSKEGVVEYMRNIWVTQMKAFSDIGLDYLLVWPYDEGGCGCEQCRPWGAKGYGNLAKLVCEDALLLYPNIHFIISTWLFDVLEDEGEFSGFYQRLKTDLSFANYIMVDSHDAFPRYPLEHDVVKPIVNFPEISMWKLFPWGGRGANPMPKRFQRFWDEIKHVIKGGMPYSEGIFEDILKVQYIGYYWDSERNYRDILAEYINYEYSSDVIGEVLEILELIEDNHINVAEVKEPDIEKARRAFMLADMVDKQLDDRAKKSWRWRILFIRTKIDEIIYQIYMDKYQNEENSLYDLRYTRESWLSENEEAQKLMQELCMYYHCVSNNGENVWTLPSVKDGVVTCGTN